MSQGSNPGTSPAPVQRFSSLQAFPHFTPVASVSPAEFAEAIAGHLPYSSFNYVSLRSYWPEALAARLGDGVVLQLAEPGTEKPYLTALYRQTAGKTAGGGGTSRACTPGICT
jgi:hypothetical protein